MFSLLASSICLSLCLSLPLSFVRVHVCVNPLNPNISQTYTHAHTFSNHKHCSFVLNQCFRCYFHFVSSFCLSLSLSLSVSSPRNVYQHCCEHKCNPIAPSSSVIAHLLSYHLFPSSTRTTCCCVLSLQH